MVIIRKKGHNYSVNIDCEETSNNEVKLSIEIDKIKLSIQVIGKNYHDALWNLHAQLGAMNIELICNGVSLNVFPTPLQFDMGLAYQAMSMRMGVRNGHIINLIDSNIDNFIKCTKEEQFEFYNKWVLSKKKDHLRQQSVFIETIKENEELLFFWGHQASNNEITKSCLSQWWLCRFKHEGVEYNSTEQWMMAEKARIFSDTECLGQILKSKDIKAIKEIGRRISLFDEDVWDQRKYDVVFEGNLLKFSQNEALRSFLLSTSNKVLVEASPYDKIWGIGMRQDEEGIKEPKKWKGQNLLGFALMDVREILANSL